MNQFGAFKQGFRTPRESLFVLDLNDARRFLGWLRSGCIDACGFRRCRTLAERLGRRRRPDVSSAVGGVDPEVDRLETRLSRTLPSVFAAACLLHGNRFPRALSFARAEDAHRV